MLKVILVTALLVTMVSVSAFRLDGCNRAKTGVTNSTLPSSIVGKQCRVCPISLVNPSAGYYADDTAPQLQEDGKLMRCWCNIPTQGVCDGVWACGQNGWVATSPAP